MRPGYERFKGEPGRFKRPVTGYATPALKNAAEVVAQHELDSVSGLVLEGLARVFEDRLSDSNFPQDLKNVIEDMLEELPATQIPLDI